MSIPHLVHLEFSVLEDICLHSLSTLQLSIAFHDNLYLVSLLLIVSHFGLSVILSSVNLGM